MTPCNLTHGQWSKNLTMATDILESTPWSMLQWSNWFFCGQILWLNPRFTFLTMEIRISAMVMVKMGIFVVKFSW